MKITELTWITHTHTEYYDVCKIYDGEMPEYLCGENFWNNHYYLINKEQQLNKEKYKLSGNFFYYDSRLPYPIRLINILSNIKSEIIVLDHEDMILYNHANLDKINLAIKYIIDQKLDSVRFIKNKNANYIPLDNHNVIDLIDKKSKWIFSIQPSIWRKDALIDILIKNINADLWQLEYRSQKVLRKLDIKIGVLAGSLKKRGSYHYDSEYYPYIATALFKGKWTTSEYPKELEILFQKYKINPFERGVI